MALMRKIILTKSADWEYEEEERVINRMRGSGIHPYRRDKLLVSVIAGIRAGDHEYSILQELTDGLPNTNLYRAVEVDTKVEIRVPGHPVLDQ